MKSKIKKIGIASLALLGSVSLAACGGNEDDKVIKPEADATTYQQYAIFELTDLLNSCSNGLDAQTAAAFQKAYEDGCQKINEATDVASAYEAKKQAKAAMAAAIPYANGVYSYSADGVEKSTEILGVLEEFGIRSGMLGLGLWESGAGLVMYANSVVLGTENYINGYGFGVLSEGDIIADLEAEKTPAWKRYYHTYQSTDPGTVNYFDEKGSDVGDLYSYFGASYFTQFMNDTKDGYVWAEELADGPIEALNLVDGTATKWRVPVKTGSDLKYSTLSTLDNRKEFNNRQVQIEDYLTHFKLMLTQSTGWERGSEFAQQKSGTIKGALAYYNASKGGFNEEAWKNVGIKAYTDENGQGYVEWEYTQPYTDFYARYYFNSSMYMPIPQEFIDTVGLNNYLQFSSDGKTTPVDNSLSLGAYTLERWDNGQQIVFKKNPNYVHSADKYKIQGLHINILTAAQSDEDAAMKEFEAGKLHAVGINKNYLAKYSNDPRTRTTGGSVTVKLNVNALDQNTWVKWFGKDGTVYQNPESEYWTCEPALSNKNFLMALSYATDRKAYAEKYGTRGVVEFFSDLYLSDPVKGVIYNNTEAHKNAVQSLLDGTDEYGYSLELARTYFRMALAELIIDGKYVPGTVDQPTEIRFEILWQGATQKSQHDDVVSYWENAFNNVAVDKRFKLVVDFWSPAGDYTEVYDRMDAGRYDLALGAISGNAYNPLEFLGYSSSTPDISQGWCTNWSVDCADPDASLLVYEGLRWSFDALYTAATSAAYVKDGVVADVFAGAKIDSLTKNSDGSYKLVVTASFNDLPNCSGDVADIVIYASYDDKNKGYAEQSLIWGEDGETLDTAQKTVDGKKVTYTITISAEIINKYTTGVTLAKGRFGFDLYYDIKMGNYSAGGYRSLVVTSLE